ncbi:hypothetical protein D3C72_2395220 [compost metagenome]
MKRELKSEEKMVSDDTDGQQENSLIGMDMDADCMLKPWGLRERLFFRQQRA